MKTCILYSNKSSLTGKQLKQSLSALRKRIPAFNTTVEDIDQCKDSSGNCYIRSKQGVVRYGNDFNPLTDLYYTKPVSFKRREYRVHVFLGKVIGIYEKVPFASDPAERPKLFKSDTCRFVRSDPSISRVDQNAQTSCIEAVKALGLDFGGIDIVRDKHGAFTLLEVNSSPGLNSQMLARYTDEINNFLAIN
jgi:hypothetical protein